MAESRHHKGLVLRAVKAVTTALGEDQIVSLLADLPGVAFSAPPIIDGHRPDLYATSSALTIIGEAKPPWDIETKRTELQLVSFTKYVEFDQTRHLILAVNWVSAATAMSIVRSIAQDWPTLCPRVHILDGRAPLVLSGHRKNNAKD